MPIHALNAGTGIFGYYLQASKCSHPNSPWTHSLTLVQYLGSDFIINHDKIHWLAPLEINFIFFISKIEEIFYWPLLTPTTLITVNPFYEFDNRSISVSFTSAYIQLSWGPFKYYVIKEVGGWGGQMMTWSKNMQGKKLDRARIRHNAHHQYQNLLKIYLSFRGYRWSV